MSGVVMLRGGGSGPGGSSDFTISTINGQLIPTFVDTTRGNKDLSVSSQNVIYAENQINDGDWIRIGNASDADSGYIAEMDGTITYASGHCENTGASSKEVHLFLNGVDQGNIGLLSGGANAQFINTTLDIDFVQGDRIRLQGQDGIAGNIQDTVVRLTLKWRA